MPETNMFGGGNPHGLYVPLTDVELDVLQRIIESQELRLEAAIDSGVCPSSIKHVELGDKSVGLTVVLAPGMAVKTEHVELQLFWREHKLHQKRYALSVQFFSPIEMNWEIGLDHLDPALVRLVLPNSTGLTSRRLDRDTGLRTTVGNMKGLPAEQRAILAALDKGEERVRRWK